MAGTDSREIEHIQDAYRTMYVGMMEKNAELLSTVLDDRFVLVHMTGLRQSKEVFIQAVLDGTLNYYSANHRSMEVTHLSERHAELDGQSVVRAAVFGGGRHTWRLRQKLQLTKTEAGWKITESVASAF